MSDPNEARLRALERENAQLRRAVEELSILNELSVAISSTQSTDELIRVIIKRSIKSLHAEQGVITLVGEDESDPTKTLVRTMASSGDREAYSPSQNLLGWMHINKSPLVVNDTQNDPRFPGVKWPTSIRSILCVPLVVHSRLIGILTLYNKKRGDFSNEDQRLLSILAGQSAQVVERTRLYEEEAKLANVQQELNLAYEIQMNLLPSVSPTIPGYEVSGTSIPAQSVGGDYFDYIPVEDGRMALTVGDVSGKGMPAALLMSNLQATLRSQALNGNTISDTIAQTNTLLCENIRKGSFVTLFFGVLNPAEHIFDFSNAGHNRPHIRRSDGSVETLDLGGLVLGFKKDIPYKQDRVTLHPGDLLFIYSDGIPEAMNANRSQFGDDTLIDLVASAKSASAEQFVKTVLERVREHAGDYPQNDDITMIAVKRLEDG
ncbi:MAG: SpoIIE family protein phosphatase [Rhodothermales bacterium]|nr:SpoIIE family protein phosphatase [Rhodothermales bacterium]